MEGLFMCVHLLEERGQILLPDDTLVKSIQSKFKERVFVKKVKAGFVLALARGC